MKEHRRSSHTVSSLTAHDWGQNFWAIGYGVWSTGNIMEEMVQEYLEHHRDPSNGDTGNIILE